MILNFNGKGNPFSINFGFLVEQIELTWVKFAL